MHLSKLRLELHVGLLVTEPFAQPFKLSCVTSKWFTFYGDSGCLLECYIAETLHLSNFEIHPALNYFSWHFTVTQNKHLKETNQCLN